MRLSAERNGEDVDGKKLKLLNDSYARENEKNTSHDTKKTPSVEMRDKWGKRRLWLAVTVVVVVLAGIGAGVGIASAPYILHELGFTSKGLVRNSYASRLMSSTSAANNHTIPKDSWVSWLQKAGQKGLNREHHAYFGSAGAIAGTVAGVVLVVMVVVVYIGARRCRKQAS